MKGNIKWITIFSAMIAVCAAVWSLRKNLTAESVVARITQNGTVIDEINLSDVGEPYEFEVKAPDGGSNTVRVENGRICVTYADCPDKICVNQGYIDNSAAPIVCLPHKLTITIYGADSEYDAVVGGQ